MANREHLQPLMAAMASADISLWNQWRKDNPGLSPDLGDVDLSGANLRFADLSDTDLNRATLTNANVSVADLRRSRLTNADLSGANLNGTNLTGADLSGANLSRTSLRNAILCSANLTSTWLMGADLGGARVDDRVQEPLKAREVEAVSHAEKAALGFAVRRHEGDSPPPSDQESGLPPDKRR